MIIHQKAGNCSQRQAGSREIGQLRVIWSHVAILWGQAESSDQSSDGGGLYKWLHHRQIVISWGSPFTGTSSPPSFSSLSLVVWWVPLAGVHITGCHSSHHGSWHSSNAYIATSISMFQSRSRSCPAKLSYCCWGVCVVPWVCHWWTHWVIRLCQLDLNL